jgi:hypothetical protein
MQMTREEFYLYSYRLINALMTAKIKGNPQKTFSELIEDTKIRDAGDRYPARLSFLLSENRKLGRIELIQVPVKPFLKYFIASKGEDYFVALNSFISYLLGMYNNHKNIDEITVEASKLADIFSNSPKIDLERYR